MIHPDTWKSWQNCKVEGVYATLTWQIAKFYEDNMGFAFTDREVKEALRFNDMNVARPKITNLIHAGFLQERGTKQEGSRIVRMVTWAPQAVGLPSKDPEQKTFGFAGYA